MRIADDALSPSSRDVSFQSLHLNRRHVGNRYNLQGAPEAPPQRRPQRHKQKSQKSSLPPVSQSKEFAKVRSAALLPKSSSGKDENLTDGQRQQQHRQVLPSIANDQLEKDWAKSIFRALPSVGSPRAPISPLAKSGMVASASAPELTLPAIHTIEKAAKPPKANRRAVSIESNVSATPEAQDTQLARETANDSTCSKAGEHRAPADTATRSTTSTSPVRLKAPALLRKRCKSKIIGEDGKPHVKPPDLADLAHKWRMPLVTITESAELFCRYASLPGKDEDEHLLREGGLKVDAMMKLVCILADKASVDQLPVSPEDIMGILDKDSDGCVDFHEFACWYHERGFEEYINLTRDEILVRRVGHKLGISAADMDFYKLQFDKYDTDGSGSIELNEFRELMHVLMKVPKGLRVPESRILHFWREADWDGSGEVDLEEFVTFYMKHFDSSVIESPIIDYYKGIRRTSTLHQNLLE